MNTLAVRSNPATPPDRRTMVQLLRRNATVFQAVFAALWAARFTLAVGAPEVIVAVAVAALAAVRLAFRATRGLRARDTFRTPAGRRFLRPVTWLTVAQLAGSVVLPVVAGSLGAPRWAVPLVAVTIGVFLIGFARPLQVPPVAWAGAAATIVSLGLPILCTGTVLLAWTAVTMVLALLACAWLCAVAAGNPDPR